MSQDIVPVNHEYERYRRAYESGTLLIPRRRVVRDRNLEALSNWHPRYKTNHNTGAVIERPKGTGTVDICVAYPNGNWGLRTIRAVPDIGYSERDAAVWDIRGDWARDELAPPETPLHPWENGWDCQRLEREFQQGMRPATYAVWQAEQYLQRK